MDFVEVFSSSQRGSSKKVVGLISQDSSKDSILATVDGEGILIFQVSFF